MKDSGVEWVGEIPADWEIVRFKYLHNGLNTGEAIDKEYWTENETDFVFYTAGMNPIRTNYNDFPLWKFTDSSNLLLSRNGTPYVYFPYGNACYTDHVIRAKIKVSENRNFIGYALQQSILSVIVTSVSLATWSASLWNEQIIPYPPLSEQNAIANFLDKKCAEIDKLTADIKTQIEVLENYKHSIITETVTKGLNPNVEMKDSGVEWVGEIPADWEIHPVYYYFGERKHKNTFGKESNLLSLSYGKIIRKDINTNDGLLPESFNSYNIVEAEDIIIRPTDLQNDKRSLRTGLATERGIITSAYIALMPIKSVNTAYYHYLLHAFDVMKVFYNMGSGVRQGLNFPEFSKLMLFEPSLEEQNVIVNFLDDKCAEIDKIIADKNEQLAALEEYKKSLIYEYVTGKKSV